MKVTRALFDSPAIIWGPAVRLRWNTMKVCQWKIWEKLYIKPFSRLAWLPVWFMNTQISTFDFTLCRQIGRIVFPPQKNVHQVRQALFSIRCFAPGVLEIQGVQGNAYKQGIITISNSVDSRSTCEISPIQIHRSATLFVAHIYGCFPICPYI